MTHTTVRRIVTGHDARGKSVVVEDGPAPRAARIGGELGPRFHEIWNTRETPARIDRASGEPREDGIQLRPPANGTRIRVLDIPPEDERLRQLSPEAARAHFAQIGAAQATSHSASGSRHPLMHRTESIDYGIVLDGEITLILDDGETLLRAGDIVIQRGTHHGWANRSARNCRIAFVLVDGRFDTDIA